MPPHDTAGAGARLRQRLAARLRRHGVLAVPPPEAFTPQQLAQLRAVLDEARPEVAPEPPAQDLSVLDVYSGEEPSPQTAVDVFAGEWASAFPAPLQHVRAGGAPLFEVEHVPWGVAALGGVEGQRVVELGPLEGGHTYLLDRLGAAEVVAVEANSRAFLKCLVSKELLGIPSGRFLHGDALRYLEGRLARSEQGFDLVLASGVLYHFRDPVAALHLMTRTSDRLLLWTMYYDEEVVQSRPDLAAKFTSTTTSTYDGFRHTLHRQEYGAALDYKGFCGGSAADSAWLSRADVLAALDHFGFEVVDIAFEEQDHKGNGPCFCVAARRRGTA